MSKRKKRAFPGGDQTETEARAAQKRFEQAQPQETYYEGEPVAGFFGFFRDAGVRETVESIIVAVVLALLFRAYEAEAFIIPTGSMAPTLMGQHMDVDCEKCHYSYRTGASEESSTTQNGQRMQVRSTLCPVCRYEMRMRRKSNPDHNSNNGDRILVNKFVYDFADPKRWDVIVFKNPNNGKQNYIKRLVGLPGDNLLIERGDIYNMEPSPSGSGWAPRTITRKPAEKVPVMLQLVDDTDHVSDELREVGWPSRWNEWSNLEQSSWTVDATSANRYSLLASDEPSWLRYRHLHPRSEDWTAIEAGGLPRYIKGGHAGELISDYYCYNDKNLKSQNQDLTLPRRTGAHWVGDLAIESWIEIQSSTGTLLLDLVEGGAHFTCSIDVATGQATLACNDSRVAFEDETTGTAVESPKGQTGIKGSGSYKVMFANVDDKIFLWINSSLVEFDGSAFVRTGRVVPRYSDTDPGDAEPLGIGGQGLAMNVSRLKVHRDIYYSSTTDQWHIANETKPTFKLDEIRQIFRDPKKWAMPRARSFFAFEKGKDLPMFPLAENQFLPMGDNSPASLDGRVWNGPRFVDRSMLIGRAMFVYWPHSLNKPIPFFPNFKQMGFIR